MAKGIGESGRRLPAVRAAGALSRAGLGVGEGRVVGSGVGGAVEVERRDGRRGHRGRLLGRDVGGGLGTAEHGAFSRKELDQMVDLAQGGITQLFAAQKQALGL